MSGSRISAALEASNRKYEEFLNAEKKKKEEQKAQREKQQQVQKVEEAKVASNETAQVVPNVNKPAPVASSWLSYLPLVGSYFAQTPVEAVVADPKVETPSLRI